MIDTKKTKRNKYKTSKKEKIRSFIPFKLNKTIITKQIWPAKTTMRIEKGGIKGKYQHLNKKKVQRYKEEKLQPLMQELLSTNNNLALQTILMRGISKEGI